MAIKKTKKLSGQTVTATVAAGEKFAKVDSNGNVTLIDTANLKAALMGGLDLDCMMDNVFIMYHNRYENYPLMVKPDKWMALQSSGEIADGVVVVEGGKALVVAPTDTGGAGIAWSSAAVNGGAVTTDDRVAVMADWNGKANTASIIAKSAASAVTNTGAYAPGFCNLYSRTNANGKGLTAGKWWLPSAGEMMMIYAHMVKINYCLGLISGASQLLETRYWTSTEFDPSLAWVLRLTDGSLTGVTKIANKCAVRPVSAFIE